MYKHFYNVVIKILISLNFTDFIHFHQFLIWHFPLVKKQLFLMALIVDIGKNLREWKLISL